MNKITFLAAAGIAFGLLYLVLKEAPAPVSAPRVKRADEFSANLRFQKGQLQRYGSPAAQARATTSLAAHPRPKRPMLNRREVRRPQSVGMVKAESSKNPSSSSPALSKHAVVKNGEVKVPRANDSKWVTHLSGEGVDLEIRRNDLSPHGCTDQICPDRSAAYTLVGVVVEPKRILRKNQAILDGVMAAGDGQKQPFAYLK